MSKTVSFSKYEPLKQETLQDGAGDEDNHPWKDQWSVTGAWKIVYALSVLLALSIASNALLYLEVRNTQGRLDAQSYGMFPPQISRRLVDMAEP